MKKRLTLTTNIIPKSQVRILDKKPQERSIATWGRREKLLVTKILSPIVKSGLSTARSFSSTQPLNMNLLKQDEVSRISEEMLGAIEEKIIELSDRIAGATLRKRELQALHRNLQEEICLLYTSPSPRDLSTSRMPSSA
eukprot:TRINITY_DN43746_c0_g1_i2.p1 TRINITY_DN43746_c0_g1~~TRINITY_DN43746_c0_g1_i2.p1  ORF type:complete len:148 (+),score=27.59 TRINITY_DN43746_c0_g1_i2:29-445(+)